MTPELIFDPKLEGLISHCETKCVKQCCGIDSFDFSPVSLAYYLKNNPLASMSIIDAELKQLQAIAESHDIDQKTVFFSPFLNDQISISRLTDFIQELRSNLNLAIKLNSISEKERFNR